MFTFSTHHNVLDAMCMHTHGLAGWFIHQRIVARRTITTERVRARSRAGLLFCLQVQRGARWAFVRSSIFLAARVYTRSHHVALRTLGVAAAAAALLHTHTLRRYGGCGVFLLLVSEARYVVLAGPCHCVHCALGERRRRVIIAALARTTAGVKATRRARR